MKAVLLAPEFAATDGGIQRILRLYLRALAADPAHHSLALVALNDTPADLQRIPLFSAPALDAKPLVTTGCSRSKFAFLRATVRACFGADRIVCGHLGQLPVAALSLLPGARLALVAHGIEVWQSPSLLQRLALRRCDRVFCVSRYTRDRLAVLMPWLTPRLRVVPNALDPDLLDRPVPAPPPVGLPPVILCVGRLCAADAYKGYDQLLRAFALLPVSAFRSEPDLVPRLRFVGDGDDRSRLEALASELNVAHRVEFSGRLDDAELRRAFADCTCFALPSTGEGFGLVYLEAMAAGRPCVGLTATAVPELITPDVGVLAPPDDPAALAAALTECIAHFWDPATLRRSALRFSYPHLVTALATAWAEN
jgi:glycosyltransferase involved in cell wall biosynthesis